MIKIAASAALATMSLSLLSMPTAHANDPPPPVLPVVGPGSPLADVLIANPGIADPDLIYPGEILTLPGRDPHTVLAGETLNQILGGAPAPTTPPPQARE
jgi:hypothetical protein